MTLKQKQKCLEKPTDSDELFFVTPKKYLKKNIASKEELLEKYTQIVRNLPKEPTSVERNFWLKATDLLADNSGFKKDSKPSAAMLVVNQILITPDGKLVNAVNGKEVTEEALPKPASDAVLDVKPI